MRVCQFRHDGNLNCKAAAAHRPPCQEDQHLYFTALPQPVKPAAHAMKIFSVSLCLCGEKHFSSATKSYSSFAVIEIFAFSAFDTGQPFSAASAYF